MRQRIGGVLWGLCLLPLAASAAPPQRTFVAPNGLDTNPCSLAAPCRSFGTAVTAVATGGEVVVLDSAGYGAVTIGKSVSLVTPPGIYAGVSVFGGAGVTVDGAGIVVALRGLSIVNQGGGNGIDFLQGASLHVEGCVVSGFTTGIGINVLAAGSSTHVVDTIVRESSNGLVFNGNLRAFVSRTHVERNANEGIEVLGDGDVAIEDSAVTGSAYNIDAFPLLLGDNPRVTVARSLVSGGGYGVIAEPNATFARAEITVMDSTIANMTNAGIAAQQIVGTPTVTALRNQLHGNATALKADGPAATLILEGNAVVSNTTGVSATNGATVATRGTNTVSRNGTDTVGTPYSTLIGL